MSDITTGRPEKMTLDKFHNPIPVLGFISTIPTFLFFTGASPSAQSQTSLIAGGLYYLQAYATASTNAVPFIHFRPGAPTPTAAVTDPVITVVRSDALNSVPPVMIKLLTGQTVINFLPTSGTANFNVIIARLT